jgi:protein-tyrosine phosphatase
MQVRVLFVCMGNICRSPTAEGVFRHFVQRSSLQHLIEADSAGTHGYHIGDPPDERAQATALRRGYDLSPLRARQVTREDFHEFDSVLAMDNENLRALQRIRPPQVQRNPMLFLSFSSTRTVTEVPDPYYGGPQGFEHVLDLVEDAAQGLLRRIREDLGR